MKNVILNAYKSNQTKTMIVSLLRISITPYRSKNVM